MYLPWIDRRFGTSPWGMLGGVVIGIVGGLYNLVKESLHAFQQAGIDDAKTGDASPGEKK